MSTPVAETTERKNTEPPAKTMKVSATQFKVTLLVPAAMIAKDELVKPWKKTVDAAIAKAKEDITDATKTLKEQLPEAQVLANVWCDDNTRLD